MRAKVSYIYQKRKITLAIIVFLLISLGFACFLIFFPRKPANAPFITASGTDFLSARSKIRFTGYQIRLSTCYSYTDEELTTVFDQIQNVSKANLVRVWFFQSSYVQNGWTDLDRVISNAKSRNMYVAVTLVNEWGDCEAQIGGQNVIKHLSWFQAGYTQTNDGYPQSFRSYAVMVAGHYASEPNIAFWQIINEPRADNNDSTCSESTAATAVRAFADDVAGAMKAVDPNHLISLGASGGTEDCGLENADYQNAHAGQIDICEYHDYGAETSALPTSLNVRIRQCGKNGLNKPLVIGEAGINADVDASGNRTGSVTVATLTQRAIFFDDKMQAAFINGIGGYLIWMRDLTCCTNNMNIGPGDPIEKVMAYEQTAGIALRPPMGYNDVNSSSYNVSETLVKNMADAMVSSGMQAVGYQYVNLDDGWEAASRDGNGNLIPNPTLFPDGMKATADYVHSKGLKFGIYTSSGQQTSCGSHNGPGSLDHEQRDAATFASWGVDYIKVDWCNVDVDYATLLSRWQNAVALTGRQMVLSISNGGGHNSWVVGPGLVNLWRTTGDISNTWDRVVSNIENIQEQHAGMAGLGHWNDPDMMEVGNSPFTDTENTAHFSMWAILGAPLLAGNDLTAMSDTTKAILTNAEVIAVDQDSLGSQGVKISDDGLGHEVWAKLLSTSGTRAVALFNSSTASASMTVNWSDLALQSNATVRDLWTHTDLGTFSDSYTATIPPHGVALLKVTGTAPSDNAITRYLSDLPWIVADNGNGSVQKDKSTNGNTLTLNGTTYAKGLGAHAQSDIEYALMGKCTTFTSDIGVDDEVNPWGSVVFQVWADGQKLYDSGLITGGDTKQHLSLPIQGKNTLALVVLDGGDGTSSDHADWAGAQLTCYSVPANYGGEVPENIFLLLVLMIIPPAMAILCAVLFLLGMPYSGVQKD